MRDTVTNQNLSIDRYDLSPPFIACPVHRWLFPASGQGPLQAVRGHSLDQPIEMAPGATNLFRRKTNMDQPTRRQVHGLDPAVIDRTDCSVSGGALKQLVLQ